MFIFQQRTLSWYSICMVLFNWQWLHFVAQWDCKSHHWDSESPGRSSFVPPFVTEPEYNGIAKYLLEMTLEAPWSCSGLALLSQGYPDNEQDQISLRKWLKIWMWSQHTNFRLGSTSGSTDNLTIGSRICNQRKIEQHWKGDDATNEHKLDPNEWHQETTCSTLSINKSKSYSSECQELWI